MKFICLKIGKTTLIYDLLNFYCYIFWYIIWVQNLSLLGIGNTKVSAPHELSILSHRGFLIESHSDRKIIISENNFSSRFKYFKPKEQKKILEKHWRWSNKISKPRKWTIKVVFLTEKLIHLQQLNKQFWYNEWALHYQIGKYLFSNIIIKKIISGNGFFWNYTKQEKI